MADFPIEYRFWYKLQVRKKVKRTQLSIVLTGKILGYGKIRVAIFLVPLNGSGPYTVHICAYWDTCIVFLAQGIE